MFSPLEQFDAIRLIPITFYIDLSFFNILLPLILLIALFAIITNLFKNNYKLIPTSIQRLFEMLIEFIFNLIKQQIGKEGYIFFPLIFTLFNFVLICNLISLIPFGIALTSHIILIM